MMSINEQGTVDKDWLRPNILKKTMSNLEAELRAKSAGENQNNRSFDDRQ